MYDTVVYEEVIEVRDTVQTMVFGTAPDEDEGRTYREEMKQCQAELEKGMMPARCLSLLHEGVPEFKTVAAGDLDSLQLALIGTTFKVVPSEIKRFRWGRYLAPPGDPKAGMSFCTIWRGNKDEVRAIAPSGKILEKRKP